MTHAKLTELRKESAGTAAMLFPEGWLTNMAELWTLARFFEEYALGGSGATRDEFGPKQPKLALVPAIGLVK